MSLGGSRTGHEIQINPIMGPFEYSHTDSEAYFVEEGFCRQTLLQQSVSKPGTNNL